ncbi:MAG: HAD-IIB family hydrolase [Deltaproteobacteria bacterium]
MRPFSDLPDADLADVPGVACDLDDTLTAHGTLPAVSLVALHRLASAGVPVIVCTGRPLGWGDVLVRMLPVRAVVTENGGAWAVREHGRVRAAFVQDEATRAAGMARVERAVTDMLARLPGLARVADMTLRATDVAIDLHEAADVPDEVVARAMEMARTSGLHTVASTVHMHVSSRAPDKFEGLCAAARDVGLDPSLVRDRWLYVGDSPNDAGCFGAMARSVGVANVRAFEGRMPAWPAFVTVGAMGDGFAEVASRLLAARGV